MKILDSDLLIGILNKEVSTEKIEELKLSEETIATTIFNKQEVLFGVFFEEKEEDSESTKQLLDSLPTILYDEESMKQAVKISVGLHKKGLPIGVIDEMIAGICRIHNATIVTRNIEHFSRVQNLKIEKW